jgi:hypothetical protein
MRIEVAKSVSYLIKDNIEKYSSIKPAAIRQELNWPVKTANDKKKSNFLLILSDYFLKTLHKKTFR